MQVVAIYSLNLSSQFAPINFEFSRWPMLQCRLNFCIDLFFGSVIYKVSKTNSSWGGGWNSRNGWKKLRILIAGGRVDF